MESIFNIDKFNIIEDEENYYFFRALNMEDNQDIETGTILDEEGNFNRIRTDRERYENNPENNEPKYNKDSKISLEQVYDHIKMHHRKDTNCISLSSNANVSISYGRGYYKDEYIMVKVPKKEFGKKVIDAGQYMLEEINKKVNEYISTVNLDRKIKETLDKIDKAKTLYEIKNAIETRYTSKKKITSSKSRIRRGMSYKAPNSRISNYQAFSTEQSIEKNKIVAKLTLLERNGGMKPIIPHTANNNLLLQTIGNAVSSIELIHYGDIQKEDIIKLPNELVNIFALLQQVEGQDKKIVNDLKNEIIQFIKKGQNIEAIGNSKFLRSDSLKENTTIEEIYEVTNGKIEYGIANSIVKNMFYLAKSQSNARVLAGLLRKITRDNSKYERIIEYIEKNGFDIEPEILTRKSNKGYKISESVNLNLKPNEIGLVDQIKSLTDKEQIEILEKGGLSNVRNIMTSNFEQIQTQEKITRDKYYAEAIFSLYDWQKIGIDEFTFEEKNNLLQKMQDEHCGDLYKKLEEQGINKDEIPTILLNILTRKNDFEIKEEDTPESIKEKRLEQYDRMIKTNLSDLKQELSIERVESFLGYYDIKETGIRLRPYQQRAVEKANEIFEENRFASVILPTGAGKSFVALSQLMEHKNEEILYLAPQNEILEQMKDYIIKYIHGSVNTIGRTKDEIISDIFPNIKFSTYTGLLNKEGKDSIDKKYGFVVLDELHRTGAKEWGEKLNALLDNQDEKTKVLGITATPRRDIDGKNMANEIAERLGYTNIEAVSGKHIAMNMSLINAIRMGLVVNPKIISCEYSLKTDGSLEELKKKIDNIKDVKEKNEKLEKYEKLRQKLDKAEGILEILQSNVKKGEKYIVFLPVVDKIEDEDGNVIGRKKAKSKIKDYEKQIAEYFKGSNITPKFHSMLGEYGDKENERRLEEFQNADTDCAEFMLVMNKANEGLHLDKLDGIIWLRPLDENSRILYLQQLGRCIYSEDPDNPTKDEDRPVVIDLVNNTLNVNWHNEITEQDDIEMLNIIVDWTEKHDGILPDINSTNREETGYAIVLKEIQNKYKKYLEEDFDDLNEKQIEEIKEILRLSSLIDLWQIELPDKISKNNRKNGMNFESNDTCPFQLTGILKDFVEINDSIIEVNTIDDFINILKKLKSLGADVSKIVEGDTTETLAKKSGIDKSILIDVGIDCEYRIGYKKENVANAYRGYGENRPPTEKQVQELLQLGISLDIRDTIQEFIDQLKELQAIGVNVSKITSQDTVETLAKKSGIDKSILIEAEIKPKDLIGKKRNYIVNAYRGNNNGKPPTEKQAQELVQLGIRLELRDKVQEFIEQLKELQTIGVNISKITSQDTVKTLAEKSEIDKSILIEAGIDPKKPIGSQKTEIVRVYRGKRQGKPLTDKQIQELMQLGIRLEAQDKVQEFIDQLKKLETIGVNVSKITSRDTAETLAIRSGINISILIKSRIDPKEPIGSKVTHVIEGYRGHEGKNLTEKQVQELMQLGIRLEMRDTVQEFIDQLKELKAIGVNVSKITKRDTIETLAKKSGVDKLILIESGINPEKQIGTKKTHIASSYRGKGGTPPTEKQLQEILELGINFEKKSRTGKEIVEASIGSLKDIKKADEEDKALKELLVKTKEGGIKIDEQS